MTPILRGACLLIACLGSAALTSAQDAPVPAAAGETATADTAIVQSGVAPEAAEKPPARWHLYGGLGYGAGGGDYGQFLEKPIPWELRIAKATPSGKWRFGGGMLFGSMTMKPPYEEEKEWARIETFLTATRVFNPSGRVRPYLLGHAGFARVHPRSELFWFEHPVNLEPGENPTNAANGFGLSLEPGVELELKKGLALDVSGFWNFYKTSDYSLTPPMNGPLNPPLPGGESASTGKEWGIKVGLAWQPFAGAAPEAPRPAPATDPVTGKYLRLPPPDGSRDAWGVKKSWGWATAEMFLINFGASTYNEYFANANFNQISPRSFWHNFEEGFTWDDNHFRTNQLIHPFNGATYFNAARANGIGFWGSSAMSVVGAFVWECCGETHPMSFNDMVSTGIGGIARGEMAYRISSAILDNAKRGKGRFGREFAAFLVDPIRGFNRVVTGDAWDVKGHPADPMDDHPPNLDIIFKAGGRVMGEGESISHNTNYYGFIEAAVNFGSPWENPRRQPFDRFDLIASMNFGDKTRLGKLVIRGDLLSKPIGESKHNTFAIQQDFDYVDNEAYEFGGQSFGAALQSRYDLSPSYQWVSFAQVYGILLGAVNSDYSFLADVAEQERLREYDYGPGAGASWDMFLLRKGVALANLRYRYNYISVSNGSTYNGDNVGLAAKHNLHQFQAKLDVPIAGRTMIGADGTIFLRQSHYDVSGSNLPKGIKPGKHTIDQRNPEIRVYLAWHW